MFRTVTQTLSFLDGVVASVKKFGTTISQSYERQASAILQAGETFSASFLTFFQVTVTRLMEAHGNALLVAERAQRAAERKLKTIRDRRNAQISTLARILSQVRTAFDGAHGRGMSDRFLGLESEFLRVGPRVLLRYAYEAIEVLLGETFQLPEAALKSAVLTPTEYAAEIRPAAEELQSTLVELEDQKRETEEAQKVRAAALAKCNRTVTYGSRLLEALYVLAGEDYHAKRLRPNVGQRIAPVEEPGIVEPVDGEPVDGEPSDGEPSDGEPGGGEPAPQSETTDSTS